MRKKLKKYRKSNNLSKKELAKKLKITLRKYKEIESLDNAVIDEELMKRINDLFAVEYIKPPKLPNWLSSVEKLSSSLKPYNTVNDKINELGISFYNPRLDSFVNKEGLDSMNKALELHSKVFESTKGLDVLNNSIISNTSWTNMVTKDYKDFEWVSPIVNKQVKIQKNFQNFIHKDVLEYKAPLTSNWSNFSDVSKLTEALRENKPKFIGYLDFNSKLAKSITGNDILSKWLSNEDFKNSIKPLTTLGFITGTSFIDQLQTFDEADEASKIIEDVKDDPEFKEKSQSFLDEFSDLIQSEDIDLKEDVLESFYTKVFNWVGEYFSASKTFQIKITKRLVYQFIMFTFAIVGAVNIQIIQEQNKEIIANQLKMLNLDEQQIELLKNLIETKEVKGAEILQAQGDVNLRSRPNAKSRILAVVPKKQNLTVLKRNRVWILVGYEEFTTKNTRAGWVKAEFFEEVK